MTAVTPPPTPDSGRYVSVTGTDIGTCAIRAVPCRTINYAVGEAAVGETVHVAAGTYDEMVAVTKSLVFEGANANRSAGVTPATRTAESIVKGFRNPGEPHPDAARGEFSVTVNGFTIDPQGDAGLIAAPTHHLVSLFGGPQVSVKNNVFNGGPWVSGCGYDCTTMTDAAVMVQSGTYEVRNNSFTNFRSPIDVTQFDAGHPVISATVAGNSVTHVTNRAVWVNEYECGPFPGVVTVSGIQFYVAGACGATTVQATIASNQFDGGLWSGAGLVDAQKIGVRWNGQARPNDLVAACNWWGSADGAGAPGASTASVGVTTTPWMTSANDAACSGN